MRHDGSRVPQAPAYGYPGISILPTQHAARAFPLALVLACLVCSVRTGQAQEADTKPAAIPPALFDYVAKDDDAFAWQEVAQTELPGITIRELKLASQRWQGITWSHTLAVYEPADMAYPNHLLLMVTGGRTGDGIREGDKKSGIGLAKAARCRVATLQQVPNQPLFDDRYEDDLITETWLKYLETGDASWPLLLPMVKSAVRAMDALQADSLKRGAAPLKTFAITGASKRGWTSWLTPVVDKRIIATAPIVIDTLNFRAQMQHQLATWGAYSEQIKDYTSKGLIVEGQESEREMALRRMMDPYTYRQQLTLPKLLVNGTNDPYWVVDAMQWYWDDLQGPKYILQVPNAGHGLQGGQEYALKTIAAFSQHAASGRSLPDLSWTCSLKDDQIHLSATTSVSPSGAMLWTARSSDKDFRNDTWSSQTIQVANGLCSAETEKPESGYIAQYIELRFDFDGLPYSLCTQICRH